MAESAVPTEALTCAICLELLKEPLTIPCGHSFCSRCVQSHWDQEDRRSVQRHWDPEERRFFQRHWDQEERRSEYSCPECRQRFRARPELSKNIKLAALVEQLKKTGLTAPPGGDCVAAPGDVPCDLCSGTKLKAVQSCLQCLVSYCERHLQPHRDVAVFEKHKLVAPCHSLQKYLCSEHNEVKKMFCRSDQQLLCVVCCLDQHKGHDTVSCAVERAQRQTQLEDRKQQLLKSIRESETGLKRLQEEAQTISRCAQDAVQHSGNSFTQMIRLLEKKRSEVEQQIRDQERSELRRVQELQDQVQLDIGQNKKSLSEINALLKTADHNHFLQLYSHLPTHRQSPAVSTGPSEELLYFDSVTTALSVLREKIQLSLSQSEAQVSTALKEVHTPLFSSRWGFLKYACDITLDPNTAHTHLCLSEGNRRVTRTREAQIYPHHPDRFTGFCQVLSREALTGRCYFEVERKLTRGDCLAVCYRDIVKAPCYFGENGGSWALDWKLTGYSYWFNGLKSEISGPVGSRLGVFLNHSAGLLSFYTVEDQTLSLVHRVKTKFTQPLHVGVWVGYDDGNTVYFPKLL